MRAATESHVARWRRYWHLHCQGWLKDRALPALAVILLVSLCFALRRLIAQVEGSAWWLGAKPATRYLLTGSLLEGLGITFLMGRLRGKVRVRWTFLGLKAFVGEIGMIVSGIVLLVMAVFRS
jgi:hypothetical protein